MKITLFCKGDLWLSLRYRPPVTISDTACTFTSNLCKMHFMFILICLIMCFNLVLREPERSSVWFQGRKGCFEVPKLGKLPAMISVPELDVSILLQNPRSKLSWLAHLYSAFLVLAAVRAPPEVALQCVAGHCYYHLSVSFLFSLRPLLLTHFGESPEAENSFLPMFWHI